MRRGTSVNEYGTPISLHRCNVCGQEFTLCPAREEDDTCGDPGGPNGEGRCASYDPSRDVDLLFSAAGGALLCEPDADGNVVVSLPDEN